MPQINYSRCLYSTECPNYSPSSRVCECSDARAYVDKAVCASNYYTARKKFKEEVEKKKDGLERLLEWIRKW